MQIGSSGARDQPRACESDDQRSRSHEAEDRLGSLANLAAPHDRVLPPGEFTGIIVQLLSVYSEGFLTTVATVSRNVAMVTNVATS